MKDIDPWGVANFNHGPSGLIGRIYVGNHKTFLYTEYKLLARVLTRILKTGFIESIPGKSWSQN